jgi:hypothetical protein
MNEPLYTSPQWVSQMGCFLLQWKRARTAIQVKTKAVSVIYFGLNVEETKCSPSVTRLGGYPPDGEWSTRPALPPQAWVQFVSWLETQSVDKRREHVERAMKNIVAAWVKGHDAFPRKTYVVDDLGLQWFV